ncbi:unnamed protein product [Arabidopsis thaliana]|uniref:(thale cress) hypothetical protein n=1 Tax=Arabidopsis thaliana TaxID=3702 RepID=A0A7G2FD03_ARATH|nr:unnamed protein product [Arabidopsis thaliana]
MRSHEGTRSMKSQRRLRIRNEARVIVINGIRTEKERKGKEKEVAGL